MSPGPVRGSCEALPAQHRRTRLVSQSRESLNELCSSPPEGTLSAADTEAVCAGQPRGGTHRRDVCRLVVGPAHAAQQHREPARLARDGTARARAAGRARVVVCAQHGGPAGRAGGSEGGSTVVGGRAVVFWLVCSSWLLQENCHGRTVGRAMQTRFRSNLLKKMMTCTKERQARGQVAPASSTLARV
eukprot:COSAG04_NODE_707_length_10916_cov_5.167052_5_plen_188_part_00